MVINKIKKGISLLLVLSILASAVTVVYAADNGNDYFNFNKSVLTQLGVALPEGAKADAEVTRAQFITMLATLADIKPADDAKSVFTDVNTGSDEGKYIARFCDDGYVNGTTASTFEPGSVVTFEQAAVITLRMLGYGDTLKYVNYTNIAKRLSLTDSVKVSGGTFTLANAAQMLVNLFEVPAADVKTVIKKEDEFKTILEDDDAPTLPEIYRGIKLDKAVVTATPYAAIGTAVPADDNCITADGETYRISDDEPCEYIGYHTYLFYTEDKSSNRKNLTAIFAYPYENDDYLVISGDDLVSYADFTLSYDDSGKIRKEKISDKAPVIYNGKNVKSGEYSEELFDVESGSITLCDTDGNGSYDAVIIKNYTDIVPEYVLSDSEKLILRDDDNRDDSVSMDIEQYDQRIRVVKPDGSIGTAADLKAGQILSYAMSLDGTVLEVLISDKKLYARLDAASQSDNTVTVVTFDNNTTHDVVRSDYEVSDRFKEKMLGKVGFEDLTWFYFNAFGKIVDYKAMEATSGFYAYMIGINMGTGLQTKFDVKVFNDSGKVAVYQVSDKVKIDSVSMNISEKDKVLAALGAQSGEFKPQMTYLTLNVNGEITDIDTLKPDDGNPDEQLVEVLPVADENGNVNPGVPTNTYGINGLSIGLTYMTDCFRGQLFVDDSSVIMGVPVNASAGDDDYVLIKRNTFKSGARYDIRAFSRDKDALKGDVYTLTYSSVFEKGPENTIKSRLTGNSTGIAQVGFWSMEQMAFGVVSKVSRVTDANGDEKIAVYASTANSVTPVPYYFDVNYDLKNIRKGVIIRYTLLGDKMTYIEPIMDTETMTMLDEPYVYKYNGSTPSVWSYYADPATDGKLLRSNASATSLPTKYNGWEMMLGSVYSHRSGVASIVPDVQLDAVNSGDEAYRYTYNTGSNAFWYDADNYVLVKADVNKIREYITDGSDCTKAFYAGLSAVGKMLILFE